MAIRINAASSPNIGISKKIYQNSVQRSQMGTYKFSETITFCIVLYSAHLKNIARIAKRWPEDIASVVKCVKLFLPKVLRKY